MLINSEVIERENTRENVADSYCVDKLDDDMFPLTYENIYK